MSVDKETVRKIARLARIAEPEERIEPLVDELNTILKWVEQLEEVNTESIEPMTSVVDTVLPKRTDQVTDGGIADTVVENAPDRQGHYFAVPKVVE